MSLLVLVDPFSSTINKAQFDGDGNVWFSSQGGLIKYSYKTDVSICYQEAAGVATHSFWSILKDNENNYDCQSICTDYDYSTRNNDNNYIYNSGHASVFNLSYTKKGLGLLFSAKSVDNMSYRSDRTKDLQDVFINYLPALNKTHTYNLVATLYPYATQPMGEVAYQTDVLYTFKKGTKLGGKYGTTIGGNFSTFIVLIKS